MGGPKGWIPASCAKILYLWIDNADAKHLDMQGAVLDLLTASLVACSSFGLAQSGARWLMRARVGLARVS